LFESVNGRHGGKDRTGVHKDLGVLALETVDTEIRFAAVGAGVLDTETRLERERICYAGDRGSLEELRREDVHYGSRLLAFGSIAVGGHDNRVKLLGELMDHCLEFDRFFRFEGYREFERFVSHVTEDDNLTTDRKVLQEIVAGLIGDRTNIGSFDLDIDIREMLPRFLVQYVAHKVRIVLSEQRSCHQKQQID
jgi:hypothetical protein